MLSYVGNSKTVLLIHMMSNLQIIKPVLVHVKVCSVYYDLYGISLPIKKLKLESKTKGLRGGGERGIKPNTFESENKLK